MSGGFEYVAFTEVVDRLVAIRSVAREVMDALAEGDALRAGARFYELETRCRPDLKNSIKIEEAFNLVRALEGPVRIALDQHRAKEAFERQKQDAIRRALCEGKL